MATPRLETHMPRDRPEAQAESRLLTGDGVGGRPEGRAVPPVAVGEDEIDIARAGGPLVGIVCALQLGMLFWIAIGFLLWAW